MIVVIDDRRVFKASVAEQWDVLYLRTETTAVRALMEFAERGDHIQQLWLDHDLGYDPAEECIGDTQFIVDVLQELGVSGQAQDITQILIHTANPAKRTSIFKQLNPYYDVLQVDASVYFEDSGDPIYVPGSTGGCRHCSCTCDVCEYGHRNGTHTTECIDKLMEQYDQLAINTQKGYQP